MDWLIYFEHIEVIHYVGSISTELLVLDLNLENRILIQGGKMAQYSPWHKDLLCEF